MNSRDFTHLNSLAEGLTNGRSIIINPGWKLFLRTKFLRLGTRAVPSTSQPTKAFDGH